MKTLVALLAFSIPMSAGAITIRHIDPKVPAQVQAFPDCADGMDAGTVCRYVPLNSITINVPNVKDGLPPLPIKIVLPAGFRSLHTQLHLEVSPSAACDPMPSDVYDGEGGLSITCDQQP